MSDSDSEERYLHDVEIVFVPPLEISQQADPGQKVRTKILCSRGK